MLTLVRYLRGKSRSVPDEPTKTNALSNRRSLRRFVVIHPAEVLYAVYSSLDDGLAHVVFGLVVYIFIAVASIA